MIRLESEIDVTRNSLTIEYDGRDKVTVSQPVAITRAMYAVDPGEVLAEAIGVYDVGSHGLEYRAPVGEGTGVGANTNEMFSYTALYLMADYDFTRIEIDADNDGVFEETIYLDQGEPYFVKRRGPGRGDGARIAAVPVRAGHGRTSARTTKCAVRAVAGSAVGFGLFLAVARAAAARPATADVYLFNPDPERHHGDGRVGDEHGTLVIAANSVGATTGCRWTAARGSPPPTAVSSSG